MNYYIFMQYSGYPIKIITIMIKQIKNSFYLLHLWANYPKRSVVVPTSYLSFLGLRISSIMFSKYALMSLSLIMGSKPV